MPSLTVSTRGTRNAWLAAVMACSFIALPAAVADERDDLERAVTLFEEGQYLAAQEALVAIDASKLGDKEQTLRDDYLNRVQAALTMSEKALRDLEDAETAMDGGEADQAKALLEGVLVNDFAPEAVKRSARTHLRDLGVGDGVAAPEQQPAPDQPASPPVLVNGQRARALTLQADGEVKAGRYPEARAMYENALDSVPGYPEAVAGLRQVAEHERNIGGQRTESLIERIRREDRINWQRTVAEYRDVARIIRDHVAGERFDEATQLLARARQIVEAGRQFADPVTNYESLHNEVEALVEWVRAEERISNERHVAEIRREIEAQRDRHLREIEERRARQVDSLMGQAMQHRKDGDLSAAINVLRQVTVIDPKHKPARWLMDTLEDQRLYQVQREVRSDFYKESRRSLIEVDKSKIPWADELRYPKNWPELIARPERMVPGSSRGNIRLFGALDRRLPVDFRDEPFDQVIERLAGVNQINIIVNWNDLAGAGVERRVPIDLLLPQEIAMKKVLTHVLNQAGGGVVELGYEVADGVIEIATRATLNRKTYTAVYDINDLLMEIPMFNDPPMTDLRNANRRAIPAAFQQSERPWLYGDDDDDEPEEDPARRSRVQKLIDLIQETVAPDSWFHRGGSIGSINEINGQLVITQNSAAQRQIGNLLGKLREQRAIQIAVEARFITVSSNYLEEMGIDIDFVLNSGNAGFDFVPGVGGALTDPILGNQLLLPRSFSRLGFTPVSPALGSPLVPSPAAGGLSQPFGQTQFIPQATGGSGSQLTPVPVRSGSSAYTDVSGLASDVAGSFAGNTVGPAFSLFGSFLDNIQVDFLIRATQADSRSSVLTAPRLVLFNGQRSWVAVTIQQNFVSALIPVVATGAVAQAPQVGTVDSGAVLDVQATVTADKRYVTMTLRPGVTRLLDLQTIPFSGGGAGGGFGGGTALAAFIQLPQLSSQRVNTTVSVPDGGTLLIGGQKLATETEIEAGVPVLSKIPILKRLYSSRTHVKDEQTLLMLIKPKILIQAEQEELAFPSFRQR